MDLREVTGSVRDLDGTAREGDTVRFRLERVGWDATSHYMPSDKTTTVRADATILPVELWASANGGRNILCIMPNGYTWRFRLETGDDPISLEELHSMYAPAETEVSQYTQSLMAAIAAAAVAAEAVLRAAADAALQTDITDEAGLRATADTALQAGIHAGAFRSTLRANTSLTVLSDEQILVYGPYTVLGTLILEGALVIL